MELGIGETMPWTAEKPNFLFDSHHLIEMWLSFQP